MHTKKHLGQNFLIDQRIQNKIIESCDLQPDDIVVEIGPGQGAITRLIAPKVKRLICVETDRDLIEGLRQEFPNVEIIHADFLRWDMGGLPAGIKVIGNIPYYISTPIIERLIEQHSNISAAFLTVQLEFGQRLAAQPGGKDYGALTCFVQYYAESKVLFKIKPACFKPAPKVDSCFVSLRMRPDVNDNPKLFQVIQKAFQQRRKTIANALAGLNQAGRLEIILKQLNLDPKLRPENLTLQNYVDIVNAIC